MFKVIFTPFFLTLFIVGCATQPKIQYIYSNPNIPNENKSTQWLIDRGECTQQSHKLLLPARMPCLGSGYSKGYCIGRQNELIAEAQNARQQVFDGCIAKLGYKKEVKLIE